MTKSQEALQKYRAGKFPEAVALQVQAVNEIDANDDRWLERTKRLCLYMFGLGDFSACVCILQSALQRFPKDVDCTENLGVVLRKLGRYEESMPFLERAHRMAPERVNIMDALAHSYGNLGNEEKAREFGAKSLRAKDKEVRENCKQVWEIQSEPKAFDPTQPERNIISFSLWGDNPRYLFGALRNAEMARDIYPGWTCRFYCDESVPASFRERLRKVGSQVSMMEPPKNFYDGLFWRFQVCGAEDVDRFLIRDCDSVVNTQERAAVDEWLASDKHFHVMRDFYSHTELILAGMWGGVQGALPPLQEALALFSPTNGPTATYDQIFLREVIWPTVAQSVMIHDSLFDCFDARDFPPTGRLLANRHVGQNEAAFWGQPGTVSPSKEELIALTS